MNWVIGGTEEGREMLVVHYEDLRMDESGETRRMLDFLGVEAVRWGENFAKFKRHLDTTKQKYDQFTPQQKHSVLSMVQDTINKAMRTSSRSKINLNLTRYLAR